MAIIYNMHDKGYNDYNYKKFIVDARVDVAYLPTSTSKCTGSYTYLGKCAKGSSALCLSDSSLWILDGSNA